MGLNRRLAALLTTAAVTLLAPAVALAAPLRVDGGFASHGVYRPDFGPAYRQIAYASIAPQADGTLLVGRRDGPETFERFHRFDAAGAPSSAAVPESRQLRAEATEADGRVLRSEGGDTLVRSNSDGTPDPSFGTQPLGAGRQSDSVGFPIEQIAVAESGAIYVAGARHHLIQSGAPPEPEQVFEQVCVARLDTSGRLDPGFGHGGIVAFETDLHLAGGEALGLAPRPGGGVVAIDVETGITPSTPAAYPALTTRLVGLGASGALDPGYGTGGVVQLNARITAFQTTGSGKVLLAGQAWNSTAGPRSLHESDLFLARYADDGRPDPSFAGGAAAATVDFGGIDAVRSLLVAADGSILIGGASTSLDPNCAYYADFCTETPVLARFTAAGQPDPGFGAGGRLALDALRQRYVGLEGRGVETLLARPGAGFLVGGGSGRFAFLAALSPAGALDPGLGSGGIATEVETYVGRAGVHALAVDGSGRVLIGGGTLAGLSEGAPVGAVIRLLANGTPDPSFGEGGLARVPTEASDVIANGTSVFVLSRSEDSVSHLTAAGELDLGFGREGTAFPGVVRTNFEALAPVPDGGVLVAGSGYGSNRRCLVVKLGPGGERGQRFGHAGVATLPFGPGCAVAAIAAAPGGRSLVTGYAIERRGGRQVKRLAVARLLPNGKVDPRFGRDGMVELGLGKKSEGTAVAADGGAVLVAGRATTRSGLQEVLVRLDPAGHFDRGFGHGGVASTPLPAAAGGKHSSAGQGPTAVLVSGHRYLLARGGPGLPLIGFSRSGRAEPRLAAGALAPDDRDLGTPVAVLQRGRVLLARDDRQSFELTRLRRGG